LVKVVHSTFDSFVEARRAHSDPLSASSNTSSSKSSALNQRHKDKEDRVGGALLWTNEDVDDARRELAGAPSQSSERANTQKAHTLFNDVAMEADSSSTPCSSNSYQGPRRLAGTDDASLGSALHDEGGCKPCVYFQKEKGCSAGSDCRFCHAAHEPVGRIRIRPCKSKRERYKKIFNKISGQLTEDPDFDLETVRLPPSLTKNTAVKDKMFSKLNGEVRGQLAERRAGRPGSSGGEDGCQRTGGLPLIGQVKSGGTRSEDGRSVV